MKKLLNLLGVIAIGSTIASNVVSCGTTTTSKSTLNKLSDQQLSSVAELSEVAISSQTGSTNSFDASSAFSDLLTNDSNFATNIQSTFGSSNSNTNISGLFDTNSSLKPVSGDTSQENADTTIIPAFNVSGMSINLSTLSAVLQKAILVPMIQTFLPTDVVSSIEKEIFSKDILTTNGDILKQTFGEEQEDGTLTITDTSKYYGQTYQEALGTIGTLFTNAITDLVNNGTTSQPDNHNIWEFLLMMVNYLSQFDVSKEAKSNITEDEDSLYNTDKTNEEYKEDILSSKYQGLNSTNLSQFFTNLANADDNNGLGFRQLLFTIFGNTEIIQDDGKSTINGWTLQPIGKTITGIINDLMPDTSLAINGVLGLLGTLFSAVSENQTINSFVDAIETFIPLLPFAGINLSKEESDALNDLITKIKSNSNWYTQKPKDNTGDHPWDSTKYGTTWNDLWLGTDDNSILKDVYDTIFKILPSLVPSSASSIISTLSPILSFVLDGDFGNLSEVYSNIENTPIVTISKTKITLKDLFYILGNNGILPVLLSPNTIGYMESVLADINTNTNIDKAKEDFATLKKNIEDGYNTDDKKITTVPNNVQKIFDWISDLEAKGVNNVLSYVYASNALISQLSDTDVQSDAQTYYDTLTNNIFNINDPSGNDYLTTLFSELSTALGNLDSVSHEIFDNDLNTQLFKYTWAKAGTQQEGKEYNLEVTEQDTRYKYSVTLTLDSSTNYYKVSVAEEQN